MPDQRPDPPRDFNKEQAAEWMTIVGAMPADWFTEEMFALLAVHCRNICTLARVGKALDAAKIGSKQFAELSRLQMQYSDLVGRLASKLRLTPQARHTKPEAARATQEAVAARKHNAPWDD